MKQKLSILIYSLASGGAERVVSLLLNKLSSRYNITLVLMNKIIFYSIPSNISIIYLEKSFSDEYGIYKLFKLPILSWKYKKICKENDIDVSLSFMNRPNYINTLSKLFKNKAKIVISERAMPSIQHKNGIQGFVNRMMIKLFYPLADIVTSNSQGNAFDLKKNFFIKKVITINNPCDFNLMDKLSNKDLCLDKRKFKFITIGRLDRGKNHKLLIESMRKVDAILYIIGDGLLKDELSNLIKEYKLEKKVFLLGLKENIYTYLSKCDCFLFSSNYEGFPNVILEALSSGLAVISTDCKSGPREILAPLTDNFFQIKDTIELAEYGILTPINDEKNLLKAMNLIIKDKKLLHSYIKKAIIRAKDFATDKIVNQYRKVIES